MYKKILTAALAISVLMTGCGTGAAGSADTAGEETAAEAVTEAAETETEAVEIETAETESAEGESGLSGYFLVTNVYGDGQKPWYVALEYDAEIAADSVETGDFEVDGYDIEAVYVSSDAEIPGESADGHYVLIELSTDYTTSNYGGSGSGSGEDGFSGDESDDGEIQSDRPSRGDFSGDGETEKELRTLDAGTEDGEGRSSSDSGMERGSRGAGSMSSEPSNELTVTFTVTGEITTADGAVIVGSDESYTTASSDNKNLLVENFSQDTFTTDDGTELMYSIYLPEGYADDGEYPMVLFMPDATGEGDDVYLALTESLGGVIWTEDEWQEDYPSIVLVPQYTDENTENDAYTMELVDAISAEYAVDTDRIYLVGQSSGTIRSIKLMIDYPDAFAAGMLVAGQADSAYEDKLSQLSGQNIWFIASEGDARAYPGIQEIVDAVESEGTEVTIAQWSAKLSDEEQEALAAEMEESGTSIYWTVYDENTVMEDDVTSSDATEHMNTWRVAYHLDTVREWLFAQSK